MSTTSVEKYVEDLLQTQHACIESDAEESVVHAIQDKGIAVEHVMQEFFDNAYGVGGGDIFGRQDATKKTAIVCRTHEFNPQTVRIIKKSISDGLPKNVLLLEVRKEESLQELATQFGDTYSYTMSLGGDTMKGLCRTHLETFDLEEHPLVTLVKCLVSPDGFAAWKQFVLDGFTTPYGPYVLEYVFDYVLLPMSRIVDGTDKQHVLSLAMHIRMCAHAALSCQRHPTSDARVHTGFEMLEDMKDSDTWYTYEWNPMQQVLQECIEKMLRQIQERA